MAARVSQEVLQVLVTGSANVRASQLTLQALIPNYGGAVANLLYPTLPGLGFSVHKKPIWSTGTGIAASGREVRVGYFDVNKWEWDLTYEYLPDKPANGATPSDLKALMGFFIKLRGGLVPFQFLDPDDFFVEGQFLGTGDGVTTQFIFGRNFNGSADAPFEPIGIIYLGGTNNIYLNGVLQSNTTYSIITDTPVNQILAFNTAPALGVEVTADLSYFFWVKFKDDTLDFEKFMAQLWSIGTVTLESLRN